MAVLRNDGGPGHELQMYLGTKVASAIAQLSEAPRHLVPGDGGLEGAQGRQRHRPKIRGDGEHFVGTKRAVWPGQPLISAPTENGTDDAVEPGVVCGSSDAGRAAAR